MVRIKKYLALITAVFYLMLSSGLALNAHYCGDRLANVGIMDTANTCCCDIATGNECCSNKTVILQLDIDQHLTETASSKNKEDGNSLITYLASNYKINILNSKAHSIAFTRFFVMPQPPLWLLFSSFIFYA